MDIVGKLPTAPGQHMYMLSVTDYFTKWVEAEAYHQVCDREVTNFIWKDVICRFGVPKEIVTDNGSQFISFDFQDFCGMENQVNGQVESTNKTVIKIIKKQLKKANGLWANELPGVLWAYRTTACTFTGETPFSLVYSTEAVIPVECSIPSARYMWLNEDTNRELLNHNLDAIDDLRDKAHIRSTFYQQKVAQHYKKNIRVRTFKIGD